LLLALALGYGGAVLLRAHLGVDGRALASNPAFKKASRSGIKGVAVDSAPEGEQQAPKGRDESTLTIRAFDLVSGEPLEGVSAALILAQTRSDVRVEGNAVTIEGPFPAFLVLELRAGGYLGLDLHPAEISPGEVDVHLVPRAGLLIRLIDEDSRQPVPSAEITVFHGAGRETHVVSAEDGTAEIDDLVVQHSRERTGDTTTDYQFRVEVTVPPSEISSAFEDE
jgi:hypothetical protein